MGSETGSLLRRFRILIVDDHPVARAGLAVVIRGQPDLEVCGEAAGVAEAFRQVEATRPDLAIVDLCLPDGDGLELIDQMKARWPGVKVLVYSRYEERDVAGRVLRAGAAGYLCKRAAAGMILDALRHVLRGEIYLSPTMATRLLQCAAIGEPLDRDPCHVLSEREIQILELVGRGLTTSQIARQLELSPKTVESHRKQLKDKLNLHNGAQLNRFAFHWRAEHR